MTRVDVKPLLQHVVRRQFGELFDDRGLLRKFGAEQDAMPLPPASSSEVFDLKPTSTRLAPHAWA